MQVTVFGASGHVGQLVVEKLLDEGHEVIAFVHHTVPFVATDRLRVIRGDIRSQKDVGQALTGSQAMISTLGSWRTPTKDIVGSAMKTAIPILEQRGVRRIITLTGSDARSAFDRPTSVQKLSRPLLMTVAPKILRDAEEHIAVLAASNLDWTVIRSPIMRSWGPKRNYDLRLIPPLPWQTIHRSAVAASMVSQLEDRDFKGCPLRVLSLTQIRVR